MNPDAREEDYRDWAAAAVRLLQGPVYDDEPIWKLLLDNDVHVRHWLAAIGVELILDREEGFAYLSQPEPEEEGGRARLVRRMPLTFETSLLLVILREEFEHFDSANTDSRRLYLTAAEIRERIGLYFREKTDQTRLMRELDRYINQVRELGFLRVARESSALPGGATETVYEVRRIVKAKVNTGFLEEFKRAMEEHARPAGLS
jgi:hypothetical protein